MVTNLPFNGTSGFKIRRPLITTNGFTSDLDPLVKDQFKELDGLLGARLFNAIEEARTNGDVSKTKPAAAAAGSANTAATASPVISGFGLMLVPELHKPIIPKRTVQDRWDNTGILNDLHNNFDKQNAALMTIGDCIDKTNALAALKYDFQTQTGLNWNYFDYNTRTVLSYANLADYLLAYAFFVKGISEVNGIINFIKSHKEGASNLINYAIVSAARSTIKNESLDVPDFEVSQGKHISYNNEQHPLILKIISSTIPISAASFKTELQKEIDDYLFNGKQLHLIENAGIGKIPDAIKPMLVKLIKQSSIEITPQNIKFFLPMFISQITGSIPQTETPEADPEQSDRDFDVQFLEDDASMLQINTSNVKCAAQLFYSMVLGEELDVFNVVNYFTHKYLIRGGIEIQDHTLRENLQLYVFSNKFTDASSGKAVDRTRPAERQMFYKQVFNSGTARTTGDVIVNDEFGRLWKVLMFESAKYIERAQESPNPDQYVSRQNVMQAVEDLQYNLSTHCCGMANVITPLIYNELNFVIRNILMHPEVTRQIVPVGGTWWRVVETLYSSMKSSRPKATVLYNKAKLGQTIIRNIAEYNPSTFENDTNFSGFISDVDAFITTQSIIQESIPREIRKEHSEEERPSSNGHTSYTKREPDEEEMPSPAKTGHDEWDF